MQMFNSSGFRQLEQSLDVSTLRQTVVANNIANVDTPNFKRSEVKFEELLDKEKKSQQGLFGYRTHINHLPIGQKQSDAIQPMIVKDNRETLMNNNRNNVDIDYEMSLMAKNQMQYNMLVEQMNHEFKMFRTSIGGR